MVVSSECWKLVKLASDCVPCESCGEPVCEDCDVHYFECDCPGPSQDDEYEYKEENGKLYAKLIVEESK